MSHIAATASVFLVFGDLCEPLDLVRVKLGCNKFVEGGVVIRDQGNKVLVHRRYESLLVVVWTNDGGLFFANSLLQVAFQLFLDCVLLNVVDDTDSDCFLNGINDDKHGVVNYLMLGQVEAVVADRNRQK